MVWRGVSLRCNPRYARFPRRPRPTAALDLDALCTGLHGTAEGLFHCTTEGSPLFECRCDVFSNKLSVCIGVAHFDDVDVYGPVDKCIELCLDGVNADAAFADEHTGASGVDADSDLVCSAGDIDLRNACIKSTCS